MDNAGYVSLSRQSGLLKELSIIANNIANVSTSGYKREGAIFAEHISALSNDIPENNPKHSLSMGRLAGHVSDMASGSLRKTGGQYDLALQGEGFFLVQAPDGVRLTRAGHFMTDNEGTLMTADGMDVLDEGGGQIQIPPETALLAIGGDGTISADGQELGRVGVVTADPMTMTRDGDNLWNAATGYEPAQDARILQGFLEDSNVSPMLEMARMVEVQRHYDAGQKLLEMEHERISKTVTTVRQML